MNGGLRLVQENYTSNFEVLLENTNETPVHQNNKDLLMIQTYKYLNDYLLISWVTSTLRKHLQPEKFSYI